MITKTKVKFHYFCYFVKAFSGMVYLTLVVQARHVIVLPVGSVTVIIDAPSYFKSTFAPSKRVGTAIMPL